MASNPDVIQQPPFDSSTLDSSSYTSPRPRHDSSALLMLPAPLAVNRPMMSSSSSIGMSRSSEDYPPDNGSGVNPRLLSGAASPDTYVESFESGSTSHRMLSPSSPFARQGPSPQTPPLSGDPFRSAAGSGSDDASVDHDEASRGGRGIRLTDGGPVPGPDGVRRISRPAPRRPPSQAPNPQNRYSRNSMAYSLPPGAAPPSPYGGSQ